MSLDYATYKHLCKQLDQKFEEYVRVIEHACDAEVDIFLSQYETTIAELHRAYEAREAQLSQEEKRAEIERIDAQGEQACLALFEAATPAVTKKEEKLKRLQTRMRFARATIQNLYLGE